MKIYCPFSDKVLSDKISFNYFFEAKKWGLKVMIDRCLRLGQIAVLVDTTTPPLNRYFAGSICIAITRCQCYYLEHLALF